MKSYLEKKICERILTQTASTIEISISDSSNSDKLKGPKKKRTIDFESSEDEIDFNFLI